MSTAHGPAFAWVSARPAGMPWPASSQYISRRSVGHLLSRRSRVSGSITSGTVRRPHCSAASVALALRRSQLTRSTAVKRVNTGLSAETPSSVAFSAMKSMRARLTGAKTSHRSGACSCGRKASAMPSEHQPRPKASILASHSPSRPLKIETLSPISRRMTWFR